MVNSAHSALHPDSPEPSCLFLHAKEGKLALAVGLQGPQCLCLLLHVCTKAGGTSLLRTKLKLWRPNQHSASHSASLAQPVLHSAVCSPLARLPLELPSHRTAQTEDKKEPWGTPE